MRFSAITAKKKKKKKIAAMLSRERMFARNVFDLNEVAHDLQSSSDNKSGENISNTLEIKKR